PENLLESELFGYDEGAFTGGRKGGKKGLFELANHGTIFLDEIGELSAPLQSRLLRVLQELEIMHVGGDRVIPVDIRVIAATNKDLEYAEAQSFRRDLFYRLSVLELRIPALRERAADALLLFDSFYRQKCNRSAEPVVPSEAFAHLICTYSWPGNIRELQNACERFFLYVGGGKKPGEKFLRRCLVRAIGEQRLLKELVAALEPFEQKLDAQKISSLQEMLGCTKEQLASKLGISRTTIWRLSK
ncbi:MAG: sigma 54-interacting transcriptional regulator, partial [Oscillospiraceae bacterium]